MTAVTMESVLTSWGQVYQENSVSVMLDSLERNAVKVGLTLPSVDRGCDIYYWCT